MEWKWMDGWSMVLHREHRDSFISKCVESLPQSKAHCGLGSLPLTA